MIIDRKGITRGLTEGISDSQKEKVADALSNMSADEIRDKLSDKDIKDISKNAEQEYEKLVQSGEIEDTSDTNSRDKSELEKPATDEQRQSNNVDEEFDYNMENIDDGIQYIIVDKNGKQLSSPKSDDTELWDRVDDMDPDGKRGLKVVVYNKSSHDKDGKQILLETDIDIENEFIATFELPQLFDDEYDDEIKNENMFVELHFPAGDLEDANKKAEKFLIDMVTKNETWRGANLLQIVQK